MGDFDLNSFVQTVCIWAIPVLFAITVHEAAHGYVARHFGDDTASRLGRISLNPLRHIDPIGTVALPLFLLALGGFLFGWAKPVPVNFGKLRNPKRDMLWVAAAGPVSNFVMAIGWALLMKIALGLEGFGLQEPMFLMGQAGVSINLTLMVLNLLPLPPLDGGRILVSLLPMRQAMWVSRIEPYGFFILIALLATNTLSTIMAPLMRIAAMPIMFILH
ncbi:site-2 protease family protein [Jeongeupia naejangsanensis]|uniref:Site-2 protease family protein n=1 Tax=Jeongeupia naejangsanensis TaxID=613195 RepID=A0ABS2BFQ3_9NEIS|nr:site-2 protease family protein [Jeongeupia naejangsanensis]MBM3114435.1 site-2 protease family protein [Jeongeupia naejangsanensis]